MSRLGFGPASTGVGRPQQWSSAVGWRELAAAGAASLAVAGATAVSPKLTVVAAIALGAGIGLLRWPPAGLVAVVLVAAFLGGAGAHYLVPGAGLPILETLLAGATAAALVAALTRLESPVLPKLKHIVPWLPAAAWGLLQVAFHNDSSLVSGVREAMIFFYPVLVAGPLLAVPADRLRAVVEGRMSLVVALGVGVTLLGAYYAVTGQSSVTSTGQLRFLGSNFAPPIFAGFVAALHLHVAERKSVWRTLLLTSPVLGFLLVNHRSAYLALIVALITYLVLRQGQTEWSSARLWQIVRIGATVVVIVLVATPVGRAGVARFETITNRNDPNIADRVQLSHKATELRGAEWLYGKGVGLAPTQLGQKQDPNLGDEGHYGIHNSYLSALHSGGALGLALLMGAILWALWRMFVRRRDQLLRVLLSISVFSLVMAAFNVFFENGYASIWVWLPLVVGARIAAR